MKCAIYARVSTHGQRERGTIDVQLQELPLVAARNGWEVVATYKDDGISGETLAARPGLQGALAEAEEGRYQILLVWAQDRLSRSSSSAERGAIDDRLKRAGVLVATPGGITDLNNPGQEISHELLGIMAKQEKLSITRRTLAGRRKAARAGKRPPSLDPYGFRWKKDPESPRGGAYVINEVEAKTVRRMYQLAEEGHGSQTIASRMCDEGHLTRPGLRRKNNPHGEPRPLSVGTIKEMLKNPTYKGEFLWRSGGEAYSIPIPTLLDPAQWERVQEHIQHRKTDHIWKHDRSYLIANMVKCGECGRTMTPNHARPHAGLRHGYYVCTTMSKWRALNLDANCGNGCHRIVDIDERVWSRLSEVLSSSKLLMEACNLSASQTGVDWKAQAEGCERTLEKLTKAETENLARHRRGILSGDALDAELERIARERKMTQRNLDLAAKQLGSTKARTKHVEELQARVAKLTRGLGKLDFARRRQLVLLLVAPEAGGRVVLHRDGAILVEGLLPLEGGPLDLRIRA